jgi:hypothetical protein
MNKLYNLARVTTATTGTGTITLGSALSGYLTFDQAGVVNGDVVTYGITDGSNSEVGQGTYTASGTTLTRDTVYRSTGAANVGKITLSGSAQVFITAVAEDLVSAAITSGTIIGITNFAIRDTSAAFDLTIAATSTPALSAGRTLTFNMGNVAHTLAFGSTANTITFPSSASYTVAGLSVAGTWSANQTFNSSTFILAGATSGTLTIKPAAIAGTNTITLPAGTTDFSATGGTSQVVKQDSIGAAFTIGQLAASDLSNGVIGSGAVVLAIAPTFTNGIIISSAHTNNIQIGRTDGIASSPFIDFNSGATAVDYDTRIQASGGTGSVGGGSLTITANGGAHVLNLGSTTNTITFPNAASYTVAGLSVANVWTALQNFRDTTDSNNVEVLRLEGDRATPTAFDGIRQTFYLSNDAGTQINFGQVSMQAQDIAAGTEDGRFLLSLMKAGTVTNTLFLQSDALFPATNDAVALGAASLSYSDLFLASGGLINWANGNAVLTHSSGILTVSTGDLRVTTAGTNSASVVTVGGTQTLTSKTLGATTLPDSGTISSGGELGLGIFPSARLHVGATYTTANPNLAVIAGTYASSVTTTQRAIGVTPTFAPSGASLNLFRGIEVSPTLNSTAFTTNYEGIISTLTLGASFSGTVTTAYMFRVFDPVVSGGKIETFNGYRVNTITNGNGITTGTVTNTGIEVGVFTAAAGSGGTILNTAAKFSVPSSSAAGNTDRALWITGNGGASSTKYAIYSDSTALSQLLSTRIGTGAANATNATTPFFYITTSAGTPTGVPRDAANGATAIQYDTTGAKLWVYDNVAGAWKGVAVA